MESLTPEEVQAFLMTGANAMTILASGGEQMKKWADSFEARGGAEVYGDEALQLVYLCNDFVAWLTPERRATIAKYRTDT